MISVLIGLWLSTLPWGDPQGFHGTGFPIATVLWDHLPDRNQPVDHPNPYAYMLNPLLIFLLGTPIIFLAYRLRKKPLITDH